MAMEHKVEEQKTVGSLVELRKQQGFLRFPDEYQRGKAWKMPQKQLFIDSVLRGYPIPAFFFHMKAQIVPRYGPQRGVPLDRYDVIDGQQRIRALHEFSEDKIKLLDNAGFKFPNFTKGEPRPWEGMRFSALSQETQNYFLSRPVLVFEIDTDNEDEVRDLFIRLQGGTPLTAQDKRDAWPGAFTDFILRTAGKEPNDPDDVGYPAHEFFETYVKGSGKGGAKRQLAAQVAMLFLNRRDEDAGRFREFCGINSQNLDEFYRQNVTFNPTGEHARQFQRRLDKLAKVFGNARPKLAGHEAIHLTLLVDSLMDGYAHGWENKLPAKLTEFRQRCQEARTAMKNRRESEYSHYYEEYSRWTASSAADAGSIQRRHVLFSGEMLQMLAPTPLDGTRQAGHLTKEIVYYRDEKQCQWCAMSGRPHTVSWVDAEFHHIIPYAEGGPSIENNLALVESKCHAHLHSAVDGCANFQHWWREEKSKMQFAQVAKKRGKQVLPPDGTTCMFHAHEGKIVGRKLVVNNVRYGSFSGACADIAGKTMNGWDHWKIQLPGEEEWILAKDWREQVNRNSEMNGASSPQAGVIDMEEGEQDE